jgi:hypothetical protein
LQIFKSQLLIIAKNSIMNQQDFLQKIEDIIPANTSLVNELCDILDLSMDSAYRRIRGATQLNISEISTLCKHYRISFDVFDDMDLDNVTFSFYNVDYKMSSFELYLQNMLRDLKIIRNSKNPSIQYACEDIPIFYNYKYPALRAFKIYYWMEAILNKNINSEPFSIEVIPPSIQNIASEVFDAYLNIPSLEIWTDTTYLSVIKQIQYFYESGKFRSNQDVLDVLDDLKKLLSDIQIQAEVGAKIAGSSADSGLKAPFELFISDVEIGNNCVLVDLGTTKAVYLGHLSFNTISTMNKQYCQLTTDWFNNLLRKSQPVSKVSEKIRFRYFKQAIDRINMFRDSIQ